MMYIHIRILGEQRNSTTLHKYIIQGWKMAGITTAVTNLALKLVASGN